MFKKLIQKLNIFDKSIILKVDGGLGSTILQYALAINIKKHTKQKIKFDTTWFEGESLDCDKKHSYELLINKLFPNIEFDVATKKQIKYYRKHFLHLNKQYWRFDENLFKNTAPIYYEGYYSHYKYWYDVENELQKQLSFDNWVLDSENQKVKDEITGSEHSVAIHLRRGDFVNLGWCCLTPEYYTNAIKYISDKNKNKKIKLFFFSNDFDYVKQEILPKVENIEYKLVNVNNHYTGHYDLYLMSLCNSMIIANSSFSISAALLNKHKDKDIIAPDSWGYNALKNENSEEYEGIDESIRNPNWTIFNHTTGEILRLKAIPKE